MVIILIVVGYSVLSKSSNKNLNNKTLNDGKLKIIASFYPLYFLSSEIGGDKAQVINITPSGSEPHDYELTAKDVAGIENSDLLVLNGGVEVWGDRIKSNLKDKNTKIITVGEGLFTKELDEEGETMKDPHVWLDPLLVKKMVEKITEGYLSIDPKNADYYKENQAQLNIKLDQLDNEYKEALANCQTRDIVTSHAAFAYLAQQYNLKQISISGISPEEEPSVQKLAEIADFARKNNIKYIFFESLVSPKLSETIANEIGAKTLVLDPIEGITEDDIREGKNYFTVMRDNLKNLQTALQCNK